MRAQAATVPGSALRETRTWEWECLVLQQPQGDPVAVAKTPTCLLTGATTPALSATSFQTTTPHPSRFWNPPPLQETDMPAKALPLKYGPWGPAALAGLLKIQHLRLYPKPTESESVREQDPQVLCVRAQVPEEGMAGRELEGWDRFFSPHPCISPALPVRGRCFLKM